MKNKYWFLSGGYIFDYLDREAHKLAINEIGECVTANASIHFDKVLSDVLELLNTDYLVDKLSNKRVMIRAKVWDAVIAQFLFIKIK
jgi:hypothetical protein